MNNRTPSKAKHSSFKSFIQMKGKSLLCVKGHTFDMTPKIVAIITRHAKKKRQRFSFFLTEYFRGTFFGYLESSICGNVALFSVLGTFGLKPSYGLWLAQFLTLQKWIQVLFLMLREFLINNDISTFICIATWYW